MRCRMNSRRTEWLILNTASNWFGKPYFWQNLFTWRFWNYAPFRYKEMTIHETVTVWFVHQNEQWLIHTLSTLTNNMPNNVLLWYVHSSTLTMPSKNTDPQLQTIVFFSLSLISYLKTLDMCSCIFFYNTLRHFIESSLCWRRWIATSVSLDCNQCTSIVSELNSALVAISH